MKIFLLSLAMMSNSFLASAQLPDNLISRLETFDLATGERQVVMEYAGHLEAPNWAPGDQLIINSHGSLYRVPLDSPRLEKIPTGFADKCNNDHGVSPDGKMLAISHYDQPGVAYEDLDFRYSQIYTVPIEGGTPTQVTQERPSFWHGWSPDGQTLAYAALRNDDIDIYTIPVSGGKEKPLASAPGLDDGPDYAADGEHIYFNSFRSGRMEIWRMKADGSEPEQLTDDAYSNWFPHPSPDGQSFVFLTYLEDQRESHPALKDVTLRLYDLKTKQTRALARFTGGQGTINVPSWSPDGKRFAFVSYSVPK